MFSLHVFYHNFKKIYSLSDLGTTSKIQHVQLECSKGYRAHSGGVFYQEGGSWGSWSTYFVSHDFTRSAFQGDLIFF